MSHALDHCELHAVPGIRENPEGFRPALLFSEFEEFPGNRVLGGKDPSSDTNNLVGRKSRKCKKFEDLVKSTTMTDKNTGSILDEIVTATKSANMRVASAPSAREQGNECALFLGEVESILIKAGILPEDFDVTKQFWGQESRAGFFRVVAYLHDYADTLEPMGADVSDIRHEADKLARMALKAVGPSNGKNPVGALLRYLETRVRAWRSNGGDYDKARASGLAEAAHCLLPLALAEKEDSVESDAVAQMLGMESGVAVSAGGFTHTATDGDGVTACVMPNRGRVSLTETNGEQVTVDLEAVLRALKSANILPSKYRLDEGVRWVVNDIDELGVEVFGRVFFLYKGQSLEYDGKHDDGSQMRYRPVYKREFGETCKPVTPVPRDQADGWSDLPNHGGER